METHQNCLACLLRQATKAVRITSPDNEAQQRDFLRSWIKLMGESDWTQSPPALAGIMYNHLAEFTGVADPFHDMKHKANQSVLVMLPELRDIIGSAPDRLRAALEISIIGNYMDAGVDTKEAWQEELDLVGDMVDSKVMDIFRNTLKPDTRVLVLGDNAGEIALDTLFVEILNEIGCKVTYAVRATPIINDATMDDARQVGLDKLCTVITSGVDTPGTVLERCSEEFLEIMRNSDVILSKGQGNFESLYELWPNVFFAFKVKCPAVAELAGGPLNTSMLIQSPA